MATTLLTTDEFFRNIYKHQWPGTPLKFKSVFVIFFAFLGCDAYLNRKLHRNHCRYPKSDLGGPSKRIIISLHVVHWFPRWQYRCCRALPELCSNYLSPRVVQYLGSAHVTEFRWKETVAYSKVVKIWWWVYRLCWFCRIFEVFLTARLFCMCFVLFRLMGGCQCCFNLVVPVHYLWPSKCHAVCLWTK